MLAGAANSLLADDTNRLYAFLLSRGLLLTFWHVNCYLLSLIRVFSLIYMAFSWQEYQKVRAVQFRRGLIGAGLSEGVST
ncbi:MAG TPA: hypothetical protein VHD63_12200, partial [Ktedonobacteraceae bacterium]|nr:hypothetical protein [Ktedonobacteraceae bacterium]